MRSPTVFTTTVATPKSYRSSPTQLPVELHIDRVHGYKLLESFIAWGQVFTSGKFFVDAFAVFVLGDCAPLGCYIFSSRVYWNNINNGDSYITRKTSRNNRRTQSCWYPSSKVDTEHERNLRLMLNLKSEYNQDFVLERKFACAKPPMRWDNDSPRASQALAPTLRALCGLLN